MGCATCDEVLPPTTSDASVVRNFHFPLTRNTHLLQYWEKFTNKGPEWKATKNSVICSNHFEKRFIIPNDRNATLDWKANPIQTIYMNDKYKEHPSLILTPTKMRKNPIKRNFQEDQLPAFLKEVDPIIKDVFELEAHTRKGFSCRKSDDYIIFYKLYLAKSPVFQIF